MSKKCTTCGCENNDNATFCSNCGSVLPKEPSEEKVNNIYQETQEASSGNGWAGALRPHVKISKKTLVAIILLICACVLIPIGIQRCNYANNVKKYVYNGNDLGKGSYFEVDYNTSKYKYVGSNINAYSAYFSGGSLETEGMVIVKNKVNGEQNCNFTFNPWDNFSDSWIGLDTEKGVLTVYVNSRAVYTFIEK